MQNLRWQSHSIIRTFLKRVSKNFKLSTCKSQELVNVLKKHLLFSKIREHKVTKMLTEHLTVDFTANVFSLNAVIFRILKDNYTVWQMRGCWHSPANLQLTISTVKSIHLKAAPVSLKHG